MHPSFTVIPSNDVTKEIQALKASMEGIRLDLQAEIDKLRMENGELRTEIERLKDVDTGILTDLQNVDTKVKLGFDNLINFDSIVHTDVNNLKKVDAGILSKLKEVRVNDILS